MPWKVPPQAPSDSEISGLVAPAQEQETASMALASHVSRGPLTAELHAAYRQARRNFADADGLRKALQHTSKGKMPAALSRIL